MSIFKSWFASRRMLPGQVVKFMCFRGASPKFLCSKAYTKEPYKTKYVSLSEQSFLLPGKERARASKLTDNPYDFLEKIPGAPNISTVYDLLDHGLEVSGNGDCIGTKISDIGKYRWLQYSEVILKCQYVGSGLINLGLKPCNNTFIGIISSNREEFMVTMYATAAYSMVLAPLHDSISISSILFIIKQVNLPVLLVNNNKNALRFLQNLAEVPFVHTLVIMDSPVPEVREIASKTKINLMTFTELEDLGKSNKRDIVLPNPEDLFCIPYTSGTTGTPKGVMITHKNAIASIASNVVTYGEAGTFGGTLISYLPTSHVYEILNELSSTYFGRRIAFYSGNVKDLMEEVRLVKPTVLPLVPRLMNVIYENVMKRAESSFLKSFLFKIAISRKEKLIKRGIVTNKSIWDKYVFKKFQDALGGNVEVIATSSAPVSPNIMKFFRCASGCHVFEAYGQTEVLAATSTLLYECDGGHVGAPRPSNHIKLIDVPEMGYFSKNDTGEICIKGSTIFRGYFKNPETTKECLEDGVWCRTGDIGKWLPNGALQIIDRKKHLFKLSQGEYIAPEKVENTYSLSKLVAQIFVDGHSEQNYVIALVVPEMQNLKSWLKNKSYGTEDLSQLLQTEKLRKDFLLELHKVGKQQDLNSLEQARNLAFILDPFSMDNDLLTPTLKLKRMNARKKYEPLFHKLYKEGQLVTSLS